MKTYYEKRFIFAEMEEDQIKALKTIEPQKHFVSEEMVEKITNILGINGTETEEELRAMRNTIVKTFSSDDMKQADGHFSDDDWCRMSMITCVIDNIKWQKGFEV